MRRRIADDATHSRHQHRRHAGTVLVTLERVGDELDVRTERALAGNLHREADKLARQRKLFVRERLRLLLDEDSFVEDGLLANTQAEDLPADGVVTGVGRVEGRA